MYLRHILKYTIFISNIFVVKYINICIIAITQLYMYATSKKYVKKQIFKNLFGYLCRIYTMDVLHLFHLQ